MKLCFSLCLCLWISLAQLFAQVPTFSSKDVLTNIPPIVCPIGEGVHHHEVHAKTKGINYKSTGAVLNPIYSPTMPANARLAIDSILVPLIANTFGSDIPINVAFDWEQSDRFLAAASPTDLIRNFIPDIKIVNVWYPISMAEKIAGQEFNEPGEADISVTIASGVDWCFDCSTSEEAGSRFDLVSVLLHEVYHGLGFFDFSSVDASGIGTQLFSGSSVVYLNYLEDGNGERVITQQNATRELGDLFTSNDLFFNSEKSENAKVFAPNPYRNGSSIAHLDQSTFQTSESSLMVPTGFPGTIERSGGLADEMLFDMGWIYTRMLHTPADVAIENPVDQDFIVELEIVSDNSIIEDSLRLHYSSDIFVSEDIVVPFTKVGDNMYEAVIPAPGVSQVVTYYMEVNDDRGQRFSNPGTQINGNPIVHNYAFGPDAIDPVLSHDSITTINSVDKSLDLFANSSDQFAGIDTLLIQWRLNDVDQTPFGMSRDTVNQFEDDRYVGRITFPRELTEDDKLEYKIVAIDASSRANETSSPSEGFHLVSIIPLNAPKAEYINEFNNDSSEDFDFSQFSITEPSGFADGALHSVHPYPEAGANSTIDLFAELKIPIILKEAGEATMIFDEIVLVEPSEPGTSFGDQQFWDYVIVEGKKLGSNNWLPFLDGYDSRANPTWFGAYNRGIAAGTQNSTRNGDITQFRKRTIDLLESENFAPQDTVLIRFRLFSDPAARGWGWAVDNLQIQDVISAVEDFIVKEDFVVFPNPANESITVSLDLISVSNQINIKVQDILGRTIHDRSINKPSRQVREEFSLEGLDSGLYLIEVSFNDRDKISQKVMKQ